MLNKVVLEGKVLSSWITKNGLLAVKTSVVHQHKIGGETVTVESIVKILLSDKVQIRQLQLLMGDNIHAEGYLYVDHAISARGNTHEKLVIFANTIEVISYAN